MAFPVETELDTVSIVLVGSFNPAIFQPMWFAAHEMISREDAESAKVEIVHPEVTRFQARPFQVSVEPQRFMATCEAIHRNLVRDLVLTCFGRILIHCPIRLMGLNRELHFSCGSEPRRAEFGFRLAPPKAWGKWGQEIFDDRANPRHGGMVDMQMRQSPRPDKRPGYIQATVTGSEIIRNHAGIKVQVNDHFEFEPDVEHPAQRAMEALDEGWSAAMTNAEAILEGLMIEATREN